MNKECVFKKKNFSLCNVPVPKGYPQSQTHVGLSYLPSKLGGYQYWLVSSPYPLIKRSKLVSLIITGLKKFIGKPINSQLNTWRHKHKSGEDFENPLLYFANNKDDGSPPISFHPFIGNPLMDKPEDIYGGGTYCSDPDIYIENSNVYIINREFYRKYYDSITNTFSSFLRINFLKGKVINNTFSIDEIDTKFTDKERAASPCFINFRGKYYYIYLVTNSYNDGSSCEKMVIRSDNSIDGAFEERKVVKIHSINFEPWHLSVFEYNGKLYSIVACIKNGKKGRCYQMFGEFDDSLDNFTIYQKPLTNLKSYRGAACVREDGLFVLYTTTVHEKIKGSKSVDGRDIIMSNLPFNILLNEFRKKS